MEISDSRLLELISKNIDLKRLRIEEPTLTRERLEALFHRLQTLISRKGGKLSLYIDGAARGNPGKAGIGVVLYRLRKRVLEEVSEYIGETTNNIAEYKALLRALEKALEHGAREVVIYSDSELLVKQLKGEYRVKAPPLAPLYMEARRLLGGLVRWEVEHIPREENTRADALANLAIDSQASSERL